jgi:hypothetical protein
MLFCFYLSHSNVSIVSIGSEITNIRNYIIKDQRES